MDVNVFGSKFEVWLKTETEDYRRVGLQWAEVWGCPDADSTIQSTAASAITAIRNTCKLL